MPYKSCPHDQLYMQVNMHRNYAKEKQSIKIPFYGSGRKKMPHVIQMQKPSSFCVRVCFITFSNSLL